MVVRDLEISTVNPIWKIHQNPQEQWIIESVAAIGKPFLISKKRWPLFVPGGTNNSGFICTGALSFAPFQHVALPDHS